MAFENFIAIDERARDGGSQLVGNPRSGDMAGAWWCGDMWCEVHPADTEDGIDRRRRVQLHFEPTHFVLPLQKAA